MKLLYKMMLFFAMFPIIVLTVNSMNIFPSALYSDEEVNNEFSITGNPVETIFSTMFVPSQAISNVAGGMSIAIVVALVAGIGVVGAWITKGSFAPVLVAIIGYSFGNMVMKSYGFFRNLFENWNTTEMTYLGLCFGVGLVIIIVITIVETPTQGRSG